MGAILANEGALGGSVGAVIQDLDTDPGAFILTTTLTVEDTSAMTTILLEELLPAIYARVENCEAHYEEWVEYTNSTGEETPPEEE